MTLAALKRILQPAGTQIPAAALPPSSTGPVTRSRARPATALAGGLLAAATSPSAEQVQGNMPGPWSVDAVHAVASAAAQYVAGPVRAGLHAAAVLSSLTAAVQLRACLAVQDPFSTIQGLTEAVGCAAVAAEVPLAPGAALLPDAFRVGPRGGPVEAVVIAPWPPLLDLVLPLATAGATRVVCCLAPVAYVCDAHVARSRWLGRLRAAGRLVFVPSAGPGISPEPASVWLVAFATRADAHALLIESGPWRLAL